MGIYKRLIYRHQRNKFLSLNGGSVDDVMFCVFFAIPKFPTSTRYSNILTVSMNIYKQVMFIKREVLGNVLNFHGFHFHLLTLPFFCVV